MIKTSIYRHLLAICLIGGLLFTSCGTTRIITDSKVKADIYVNGINMGNQEAIVNRLGPPKTLHIEAKYHGKIVGSTIAKRKVGWESCVAGSCSYGVGFFFTWHFPDVIVVPLKLDENELTRDPWAIDENDNIWMNPPTR